MKSWERGAPPPEVDHDHCMSRIFLSHSSLDVRQAIALKQWLAERDPRLARALRIALLVVALGLVGYLAVIAAQPDVRPDRQWFGRPNDFWTIAIVTSVVALLCVLGYRARRNRQTTTAPVWIVIGLVCTSFVLGLASFWQCSDSRHPTFFAPLTWTAALLKGGVDDRPCPDQPPVALEVARLSILAAIFVSVIGVATAVFRAQSDRLRAGFARGVTAVVGVDDDAQSMVSAIADYVGRRSTLVLITASPDRSCVHECRAKGARVIEADFSKPETLGPRRMWRRLDRLYLLSPDPATNLSRLEAVTRRMPANPRKCGVPLILRIDDPWLAQAWRAQQNFGSKSRWSADAVGKYEVTARRLLDQVLTGQGVERLIICGTSPLTLALCADIARRRAERDYHPVAGQPGVPAVTLVASDGDEYVEEHAFFQRQIGRTARPMTVDVVPETPSASTLADLIDEAAAQVSAVVFVDADSGPYPGAMTGTRLAATYPSMPIYTWDPLSRVSGERFQIIGQQRAYRLALDLPGGQAQDNWERAAMLIHERYASGTSRDKPSTLPWPQLSEFFRESNRRQVRNALWMVEEIGGHTWNSWGEPSDPLSLSGLQGLDPLSQLSRLGFPQQIALRMTATEFEDWRTYYLRAGWRYGPVRDDGRKIHDKLVDWATTEADEALLGEALRSLANTLCQLRALGYRSRPLWQRYRRTGVVTARQLEAPWSWTTQSGAEMKAAAGDWTVSDAGGNSWAVADDIFRTTHEHVGGDQWRRTGFVRARRARAGEVIVSREGRETATTGDWVLEGSAGEQWVVPGDEFVRRYDGPIADALS